MKKSLWIVLILCCLLLSACRPEAVVEETFIPPASQNNAEQTEQKQPEPSENESSAKKETSTEKETSAEQPSEDETPAGGAEPTTQKNEKSFISITGTPAKVSQEDLTKRAELILHGRVKAKLGEVMLNPDGKRTDASGQVVANAQVTSYEVEVYTVYKGTYKKDTIVVKTTNGRNLSPDLILYGEDETCKLAEPLERFDLTVGQECIMYLASVTGDVSESNGYCCLSAGAGYFIKEGNVFKNDGVLPLTNTLEALEKEHLNDVAQN